MPSLIIILWEVTEVFKSKVISIICVIVLLSITWLNIADNNTSSNSAYTRGNRRSSENTAHGGSWLDSFQDSSKIDWDFSDHVKIISGDAKINITTDLDPYTVAFWHFNEVSGTTAYDETDNDNDGAIYGASWTTGKFGNCLSFDGINDRVDVSDSPSLSITGSITIEAWLNFTSLPGVGRNYDIVKKRVSASDSYQFIIESSGKLRWNVDTGLSAVFNGNTALNDGEWHYIAVTWDQLQMKMYVDGSLDVAPITKTGSMKDTSDKIGIGYYNNAPNPSVWSYYKGLMDEMRISKTARSAQEIKDIYENGTSSENIYNANLTSKTIKLPQGMQWDTIIINKTQPTDTYLNVTIINASNDQPIPGSLKYNNNGEFYISYIDPIKYPEIKLNATFEGDGVSTPFLHYWGVSWNTSDTWSDSFYGRIKVDSSNNVNFLDGNVQLQNSGSLISTSIDIPNECHYDTLIINKTEPSGGSLKVTVLDAQSDTGISGYKGLTNNNINLSDLNPQIYPSIKLKAAYTTSGQIGTLHGWSLNWTHNTYPKILNINSVDTINRTNASKITINLTDLEEPEDELTILVKYKSPVDATWKTEYLSDPSYLNNRWEVTFTPPANAKLGQYSFMFSCEDAFQYQDIWQDTYFIEVLNNKPEILNISTSNIQVNRTKILNILIDPDDAEIPVYSLVVDVKYKSPLDTLWQTQYISDVSFKNTSDMKKIGFWIALFIPTKTAELGWYTLNITCNDTDTEIYEHIEIEVVNNKPAQPGVAILPSDPKTTDDLSLLISKAKDIETPLNKMEYWCYWYKDDEYMPEFDNQTIVPDLATTKYETWRCDVYPFDGDGVGPYGTVEVTILNSPPELVEQFNSFEMFEDMPAILENKLTTIFSDPDDDGLTFSVTGQNNIDIEIIPENGTLLITPAMNWYGSEYITFYAKDNSMAMAEESVLVTVTPTNDLPKIVQIGTQLITEDISILEFIVKQDEWLNLTIKVQDIDGDVEHGAIKYILNISERNNLYFTKNDNKLVFNPTNADVGSHYMTIKITDNNETPAIYISQDIKIEVLNVNDPPTVEIITPNNNVVFTDPKMLSFSCAADDIDLLIPNPTEELTYKWETNRSEYKLIGTGKELILTNETLLKPGYYEITVVVTDRAGDIAYDSVNIVIEKTVSESKPDGSLFSNYLFLGLIAIVIIIMIIIAILMFVVSQKKKKARAAQALGLPGEQVLQPVEAYQPYQPTTSGPMIAPGPQISPTDLIQSESLVSVPSQELLGPISTAAPTTQPTPQLPPATPAVTVPIPVPTPVQDGTDSELTVQQKIKLLEERLIRDEISEETYLNLKDKLEFEAKPYQPPPQLPPATSPPLTETAPILTTPAPFTPQQPEQLEQPPQIPIQPQQETTIDNAQPQQPLGPPQTPLEPQVQAQPQVQPPQPTTPEAPPSPSTPTQTQTPPVQQQQQKQIKPGSEEEQ